MLTQAQADEVAEQTSDAYSFDTYGERSWRQCCRVLARRGYDARQIEAIMRSKWTRWAADHAKNRRPTSGDLARFMNDISLAEVVKLTAETFTD